MYKCKNCWYTSATYLGKCPNCWMFGTFEQVENLSKKKNKFKQWNLITEKQSWKTLFFKLSEKELIRVLGENIRSWALYLLWGEPGIWKSTLILQIIADIAKNNENVKIWYFSWEENVDQIIERFKRVANFEKDILEDKIFIYHTTSLEDILATTQTEKFNFIILDSIQTIYSNNIDSPAWSVSQVKYIAEKLNEFCKKNNIACFIIGHVTKWWEIAWPKYLEHIVDIVLYLEGDRFWQYRFLRSKKNRFKSTDDVGIFEMSLFWLKPVYDIKERIINWAKLSVPWSVFTVWIDNGRPVLVTLEVLLNKTKYKYPQRVSIWIDPNRLSLVIAILERYLNLKLWYFDIYVNIPWEWKFYDSGLDLAIAAWIISQYNNKIIDKNKVFIGEIWLGWQILPSKLHEKRVKEVEDIFDVIDYKKIKNIVEFWNILNKS